MSNHTKMMSFWGGALFLLCCAMNTACSGSTTADKTDKTDSTKSVPTVQRNSETENSGGHIMLKDVPVEEDDIYDLSDLDGTEPIETNVDEPTEWADGGLEGMQRYLSQNINYPEEAVEAGIKGRVVVYFIVERDGSTSHINITQRVDPLLDKEAVRLIKQIPKNKWKIGKLNGKPIRSDYKLPIRFGGPIVFGENKNK